MAERVAEAEPLILAAKLTMAAVANVVGFTSQQALTEAFYRQHALSPTKWRAAQQKADAASTSRRR